MELKNWDFIGLKKMAVLGWPLLRGCVLMGKGDGLWLQSVMVELVLLVRGR